MEDNKQEIDKETVEDAKKPNEEEKEVHLEVENEKETTKEKIDLSTKAIAFLHNAKPEDAEESEGHLIYEDYIKLNDRQTESLWESDINSEAIDRDVELELIDYHGDEDRETARKRIKEELSRKLHQKVVRKEAKQKMMQSKIGTTKQAAEQFDLFLNMPEKKDPFNKRDMFDGDEYKVFYEPSIVEDYISFKNRNDKVIEVARREGIDPNEVIRPTGDTIMHLWAEFGREKLFEHFAKKGADHTKVNYQKETPFHVAAREGNLSIIRFYLSNYEIDIDMKMKDGWTAFHFASFNGYTATMEYLIKNGANINETDRFNRTALHWAVRSESIDVVKKLLQHKIDYSVVDDEGNTAFDIARSLKYYEIACTINDHHIARSQDKARKRAMIQNRNKLGSK